MPIYLKRFVPVRLRHAAMLCQLLVMVAVVASAALAQSAGGSISGFVTDNNAQPLSQVQLSLAGPVKLITTSDAQGAYTFSELPPGLYALTVTRPSYVSVSRADIAVVTGTPTPVSIQLQSLNLNSVREIGRVVATRSGSINVTGQALTTLSASSILDQGQVTLTQVLNEIPGFTGTLDSSGAVLNGSNSASSTLGQIPQIRGALPYETESLIDGHPVSLGSIGFYNPRFISSYILQDVEVAKGPGAMSANVTSAIGGTVNYLTLAPTAKNKFAVDYGPDSYGGSTTNFRFTGSTGNGKLGYALDYVINGSPGPFNNYQAATPFLPKQFGGVFINGQQCTGGCGLGFSGPPPPFTDGFVLNSDVAVCCSTVNTDSVIRNELAKLRYNFSTATSLTASLLSTQARVDESGNYIYSMPNFLFTPPAGYTGSIPAGPILCCVNGFGPTYYEHNNENMYTADFTTTLKTTSFLARYYRMSIYEEQFDSPIQPLTYSNVNVYGGVNLNNSPTTTIFNGQPATIMFPNFYQPDLEQDSLGGFTAEINNQAGDNLYTLSMDSVTTQDQQVQNYAGNISVQMPAGTGQKVTTLRAQAQIALTPKANVSIADYFLKYDNVFSTDGGTTFDTAAQSANLPRMSFVYRPTANTALRAAAGASFAPPYLSLVSSDGPSSIELSGDGASYEETLNNGAVRPETAFGYDIGGDLRLRSGVIFSADGYLTNLYNMFFQQIAQQGTYTPADGSTGPLPLYVQSTANIANARMEGVELTARYEPQRGFGYLFQGSLIRDFVYDLPPNFYTGAEGVPLSINLAVLPNVNFNGNTASGDTSGIGSGRVPYSQAYGQVEYRNAKWFGLVGAQFYGNNNAYDEPPFATMNASLRYTIAKGTTLQFSANNITGAYSSRFAEWFGGLPIPLAGGGLAQTQAFVVGPTTWRLMLHFER